MQVGISPARQLLQRHRLNVLHPRVQHPGAPLRIGQMVVVKVRQPRRVGRRIGPRERSAADHSVRRRGVLVDHQQVIAQRVIGIGIDRSGRIGGGGAHFLEEYPPAQVLHCGKVNRVLRQPDGQPEGRGGANWLGHDGFEHRTLPPWE